MSRGLLLLTRLLSSIIGQNLSWLRRFAIYHVKRHPVKDSLFGHYTTSFMNELLTQQGNSQPNNFDTGLPCKKW